MTDTQSALAALKDAVASFVKTARTVPSPEWSRPRAPGKWSPGQVSEHVTLALETNTAVVLGHAPGPAAPRLLRPLIRKFGLIPVLRKGRFPPGSKSPKVFRPGATPAAQEVVLGRLQAAVTSFERATGARPGTVDHPFFGILVLTDFIHFQEIHTEHHRAQLTTGGVS